MMADSLRDGIHEMTTLPKVDCKQVRHKFDMNTVSAKKLPGDFDANTFCAQKVHALTFDQFWSTQTFRRFLNWFEYQFIIMITIGFTVKFRLSTTVYQVQTDAADALRCESPTRGPMLQASANFHTIWVESPEVSP